MKLRHYIVVFIAAFCTSFFFASCLNDDNKIPPNCYDGILNNGENPTGQVGPAGVLADCGGPCEECDICVNGIWDYPREAWRDCGGECPACTQCNNGIKDGTEIAVDCGNECNISCNDLCGDGLLNGFEDDIDCIDNIIGEAQTCDYCPTCTDGILNGHEKGIDCGGIDCDPCCNNLTHSCTNGTWDSNDEFATDCGGSICTPCDSVLKWKAGTLSLHLKDVEVGTVFDDNGGNKVQVTLAKGRDNTEAVTNTFLSFFFTNPGGWAANQNFPCNINTELENAIEWVDVLGQIYTTALAPATGTSNKIKLTGYKQLVVPATTDCNLDPGTYTYYSGIFSGTLYATQADDLPQTVTIANGEFMITIVTP